MEIGILHWKRRVAHLHLSYTNILVVYIHQISYDMDLCDSDVMSVSSTSILVPCDLIIPHIFHGKKGLLSTFNTLLCIICIFNTTNTPFGV